MTTLVQAAHHVRRGARASYGFLTAGAVAMLNVLGLFGEGAVFGLEHMVVGAAWAVVFALRATRRIRWQRERVGQAPMDLELGCLLLMGVHAVVQAMGGLTGPFYPLLYVSIAFAGAFSDRRTGRILVLAAIAFEAVLYLATEGDGALQTLFMHAGFVVLFGFLSGLFTQAEIRRVRYQSRQALEDAQERMRADARMFRLVAPQACSERDDERLFRSSVEEVHQSLLFNLELLHRTLGLHTCVLLMLDDDGDTLCVAEIVSDSEHVAEGPYRSGSGAVGAALKRGVIMNLEHLRPGYPGICYYGDAAMVSAFVAVPVLDADSQRVRGVLCADRLEDRPFAPSEEEILRHAVGHLMRTLENERLFVQLDCAKREHTVLRQASESLGAAMTEREVLDAALRAAADVAPFDFAAVTDFDPASRCHRVRRAVGVGAERFVDLRFRDNASLTAMAVKNRHFLPLRGEYDPNNQVVFTRRTPLPDMQSLLILPLIVREEALGTLALAARRRDAFGDPVRPALQALANQLAVALANAAAVARLEALATTDGLTGCYNKRYFHEEMQSRLQAAQRFGRCVSLIIADIDHFKSVNDTYGHATGDVVIRELGALLKRLARETDVVARFGGEEFCILCEETDAEGAANLAERVREELAGKVFETELGKLTVTCSLGVATYPDHGRDKRSLFDAADRALYVAKGSGRNRVEVAHVLSRAS
ncbi:MAG: diguanylate cyclase [Myxococcales bacterium]|nr:diguanylate cyclase [Myxococcales bacterium]